MVNHLEATVDTAHRPAATAIRRELLIAVTVAPIIGLAFAVIDSMGYMANTPFMNLLGLLLLAATCLPASTLVLWPLNTPLRIHARSALMSAVAFMVIYATGWGSVLVLGYAILVSVGVESWGSRSAWAYAWWFPLGVIAGQTAIAQGAAPSLLPSPETHGVALVTGLLTEIACILIAVTTRRREKAHLALQRSEERFRSLIQSVGDLVMVTDDTLTIQYASPSAWSVGGYLPEDLVGKPAYEFADPEHLTRVFDALQESVAAPGKSYRVEVRALHADGNSIWTEITVTNLLSNPSVNGIVLNLRVITERKQLEEQLSELAFYDSLTKIPNRRWFLERLKQVSARAQRHRAQVSVLFIDLDDFKSVNDTYGHADGDELLVRSAERIRFCLRQEDTVARLGGDEFAAVLDDHHYPKDTLLVAQRIIDAHKLPFVIGGRELHITASVGITSCDPDAMIPPEELLRRSDVAMYVAKSKGKDRYELYSGPVDLDAHASGAARSEVAT